MNIGDLMKQAQQLQQNIKSLQDELAAQEVSGSAGGGMVHVRLNGQGELLALSIEEGLVRQENTQMLQDLIVAAVNDGMRKAKELGKKEMSRLTGGMQLPGFI